MGSGRSSQTENVKVCKVVTVGLLSAFFYIGLVTAWTHQLLSTVSENLPSTK